MLESPQGVKILNAKVVPVPIKLECVEGAPRCLKQVDLGRNPGESSTALHLEVSTG